MDKEIITFLIITSVLQSNCVSLRRQLEHIAKTKSESQGIFKQPVPSRRTFYTYDPRELSPILGAPSLPSHLPEAEPILPGHTLIKPALGMLKSAVKFPHKDFEDGSGVYGNSDNIGIRYDSKNERVLYTGFRRMSSDNMKKNNGQIYLKRVYLSKLPIVYKVFNVNTNKVRPYHRVKMLRQSIDGNGTNSAVVNDETIGNDNIEYQNEKKRLKPWNSKYTLDHVVLNQNAPEFSDVFPLTMDNQRQWWFYNERN